MAKIYSPNKSYTGISASIAFSKGVGETEDDHLKDWFKEHGYRVEEEVKKETPKVPEDPPEVPAEDPPEDSKDDKKSKKPEGSK